MSTGTENTVRADYERLHDEAIVIDAVAPLMNSHPQFIDWWIEGGATAVAPTVGGSELVGPTLKNLARWYRMIQQDPRLQLVQKSSDIDDAKAAGTFGIIFHFQGTTPIEDDLNLVSVYKQLGVGMIQLAYNVKNRVGDGCEERTDCGLSNFGMELIKRMNQERVIVDCTHTGYQTTMEAIELSTAPVVFSHSNVKALKPSARGITDDQIKAAAATGGLIGTVGFPAFVSDSSHPTLDELINHTEYVANLVGTDHIGIGIDYFGGQVGVTDNETAERQYASSISSGRWQADSYPPPPYHYPQGIDTPRTLQNLTKRMLERGFSEDDIKKFLGGNWVRVFKAVWGA